MHKQLGIGSDDLGRAASVLARLARSDTSWLLRSGPSPETKAGATAAGGRGAWASGLDALAQADDIQNAQLSL